jgi:hypothetical protein
MFGKDGLELFPVVTSKKYDPWFGPLARSYRAGLIWPSEWPAIWSAMATNPPHWGEEEEVPPTTYQPALHGSPLAQLIPVAPGAVSRTSTPVTELACEATSGTPRIVPMAVDPAGNVFWKAGLRTRG